MNEQNNRKDHPRVGGEKAWPSRRLIGFLGSPPRGRGKGVLIFPRRAAVGITPAWAGKRRRAGGGTPARQDHPRVGGEKHHPGAEEESPPGSPPRGRGKEVVLLFCLCIGRITPAWAGKRLKRSHRSGIFISGPIPFHSVLHRPAGSGGSRAGRDGSPAGQPQNTGPA